MPDYQLSLAIGKEGQNVRLAARLTGWRIDIQPDNQAGTDPGPASSAGRADRGDANRTAPSGRARIGQARIGPTRCLVPRTRRPCKLVAGGYAVFVVVGRVRISGPDMRGVR